jgi:uncharacterized protein
MKNAPMLQLAEGVNLPLDTVTARVGVFGISGSGKTYTSAVMAEEMLQAGAHIVCLDPLGVWWGLRVSASGGGPDLPRIYILGGDYADLPLDASSGAAIADLVIDEKLSVILDLSGFDSDQDRAKFAGDFARRLLQRNREPLHIFVDESDLFAPQTPYTPAETACRTAFDNLVRRGRVKGVGVTIISQRPAVVAKNLVTQITILVTHQLTGQQDQAAVNGWFKAHGTEGQAKQVLGTLAALAPGEAWVWKPGGESIFKQVRVRRRRTFDSSATPEFGAAPIVPKRLAAPDLSALAKRLEKMVKQAEENDPEKLRSHIATLERQLRDRPAPETVRVEVPVLTEEGKAHIREMIDTASGVAKDLGGFVAGLKALMERFDKPEPQRILREPKATTGAAERPNSTPNTRPKTTPTDTRISGPQQTILDTLARVEVIGLASLSRSNLAVLAQASPKASGYRANISALKSAGLIDYPTDGFVCLTVAGRAQAQAVEVPMSRDELIRDWKNYLSGPQGILLDILLQAHPYPLSREELADRAGVSPLSSGYRANVSALKSIGIADYPTDGMVGLTNLLFPPGLE